MGYLYESLDSNLQKEHWYEEEWIEASDVKTFVTHVPLPGYDYIPTYKTDYLYPDDKLLIEMVTGQQRVVTIQFVNQRQNVIEIKESLPALPKIGSKITKIFGADEILLNERLTEKYHKDKKNGKDISWAK